VYKNAGTKAIPTLICGFFNRVFPAVQRLQHTIIVTLFPISGILGRIFAGVVNDGS